MRSWLSLIPAGLAALTGCNDLWGDQSRQNPNNCMVQGGACPVGMVCSALTERCEPASDMAAAELALTAVSPRSAPPGSEVRLTISGARFASGATVQVNSVSASAVEVRSPQQILATAPAMGTACGPVPIRVTNPNGRSVSDATLFRYVPQSLGFQPQEPPLTQVGARTLIAQDLNEDGRTDLVVAGLASKPLALLLGQGNGTFQEVLPDTPLMGGAPAVAVGDVDSDGSKDVVAVGGVSGALARFLQKTKGVFTLQPALGSVAQTADLLVRDVTSDGKADILALSAAGGVTVFKQGGGEAQAATCAARHFLAEDLNRDGKADLVVVCTTPMGQSEGKLQVLLGKGDGTFTPAEVPLGVARPSTAVSADFNGDKIADLFIGDTVNDAAGHAYALLGKGDGGFSAPQALRLATLPVNLRMGEEFLVAAADLDCDGTPEALLSVGGAAGRVAIFTAGAGGFSGERTLAGLMLGTKAVTGLAVGDLNSDGRLDLAMARPGEDAVTVLLNSSQ